MIKLGNLEVFKVAMQIGEMAWTTVSKWNYFEKDTLGKQFVKAADSIAFNIGEGYGRYHFAENRNFCWYSRGSAYETLIAVKKAANRKLITKQEFESFKFKIAFYFRLINPYINSIGKSFNNKQ